MSKIKIIKITLWMSTIILSILTMLFAYQQSLYQSLHVFVFLAYLLIAFDKCYMYKDIPGSEVYTFTELLQVMRASSKHKSLNGFCDWSSVTNLSDIKEVLFNDNKRRKVKNS